MTFNINNFKSKFLGGARSDLFEVQMNYPSALDDVGGIGQLEFSDGLRFLCRGASLPNSSIGEVAIPFYGREVYTAGHRVFSPIVFNIINDENFMLRKMFEIWMGAMDGHKSMSRNNGVTYRVANYCVDGLVKQYSQGRGDPEKDLTPIVKYKLINMFPTDISPIELSWDAAGDVEEFSVSFRYDYWETETDPVGA